MAIVSKINRDGVDIAIENLQQLTYPNLIGFWNVAAVYNSYPRANKNFKEDDIIPEISLDQKDYSEVLYDDKLAVTSFFLVADTRTYQDEFEQIKQSISIIFQADLVALYGDGERVDEVFNSDVLRIFSKDNKYIVSDIELVEGIDNVYSDLNLTGALKKKINVSDISQRHVVKLTFDILYRLDCDKQIVRICAPAKILVNTEFFEFVASGATRDIEVVDLTTGLPVETQLIGGKIVVDCQPTGQDTAEWNGVTVLTAIDAGDTVEYNGQLVA